MRAEAPSMRAARTSCGSTCFIPATVLTKMGNSAAGRWSDADAVIDATGKYVMPGIVNTHMHWHEERVGPIPIQYERNLYLAAGVTTAREVGGVFEKTKQWRAESAEGRDLEKHHTQIKAVAMYVASSAGKH